MLSDLMGTHRSHCCVYHGCKYGDDETQCPVFGGRLTQDHPCETCDWVDSEVTEFGSLTTNEIVDGWKLADGRLCLHVRTGPGRVREIIVDLERNRNR